MRKYNWIEYVEWEEIESFQLVKLKNLIYYLDKHSGYYKKLFKRIGLLPEDIRSMKDIQYIPITTKQDLQIHNEEFYCCSSQLIADVVHTSGSVSSKPIIHTLTRQDMNRLAYNEELSMECGGIEKNDTAMIAVALDGFFVAGLAYYLGLRRLGTCVIRTGPSNFEQQLSILKTIDVNTIVGVPSNLVKLGRLSRNAGMANMCEGIKKMVLIGESIRKRDFTLNALGRRLNEYWPYAQLASTYANTELATSFCECSAGKGGHSHPDLCYPEIIDKDGLLLPEGEEGNLVITSFGAQGMPLLRYRTGDITFMATEKCKCGRTTPRIGPILSRDENMLKVGGISIYPSSIEEGILGVDGVSDYVIVALEGENGSDEVEILVTRIPYKDNYLADRIIENVRVKSRVTPRVTVIDDNTLKQLQNTAGSSKKRRFIDKRNNESKEADIEK